MAKARRGRKPRRHSDRDPAGSAREHWRQDGQPKSRYADRADANRAALHLRLEAGADLDPYQCSLCGGWHLGNRPDRD